VSTKNQPSRFEFVVTAGARARQLIAGSTPRIATGDHKKVTIAKQEVLTGLVEKLPVSGPDPKTDL
jgi:DNA-directed RNA polymerase omega subunit